MNETPQTPPELRFLKLLVTVLAGTMIVGLITIVALLVIRLPNMAATAPSLPDAITLPDGTTAAAVTFGRGWYAVVTDDQELLVFDADTKVLRQRISLSTDK